MDLVPLCRLRFILLSFLAPRTPGNQKQQKQAELRFAKDMYIYIYWRKAIETRQSNYVEFPLLFIPISISVGVKEHLGKCDLSVGGSPW
jgi:hypothetical protein